MQANNFNIHFLNQFHQECIVYSGKKEQRYKNVLFSQFAGRKNEMPFLATAVERKLVDSATICRIITSLENENIPDYFRLSSLSHSLTRQVSSYVRTEPFMVNYYKRVLGLLKPFISLINTFQQKSQQMLLDKLKALQTNSKNQMSNIAVSGDDIDGLIIVVEQFLDDMYEYYNDFNCCIDKDSEGIKGITDTSIMEQYLIKLVSLIEKIMYDTRSTQTLLEHWKVQLDKRELQVIYN